jgi:hypothetical protein
MEVHDVWFWSSCDGDPGCDAAGHPGSGRRERKVMTMWIRGRAIPRTLLPVMLYGGVSVLFTCCALFGSETQELAPVTIEEILRMSNAKVPVETMLA